MISQKTKYALKALLILAEEEKAKSKKYLWKIDINKAFRNEAIRDLREMGITSASLFPGYDGFCEMLKDRDF